MEQSGRPINIQEITKDKTRLEDVYPDMLRFGCLRVCNLSTLTAIIVSCVKNFSNINAHLNPKLLEL